MTSDEILKEIFECLRVEKSTSNSYHQQKENVAYTATTLYLATASVVFVGDPFWREYPCLFILVCALVASLVSWFVWWQFDKRADAAEKETSCYDLIEKWLKNPPPLRETWQKALEEETQERKKERKWHWTPRLLSCVAILIWTLAVIGRVIWVSDGRC